MCNEDIKNGVINLFMYVKSMKGFVGIWDVMWELFINEFVNYSWDVLCWWFLEKLFLFWEDMM